MKSNFFGWFGAFLIFAATILLLVASISAPVVHRLSFMNIEYKGTQSTFGVWGYCLNAPAGICTRSLLGYDTLALQSLIVDTNFLNNHLGGLTKALILHPIACGIAFFAFIIAAFANRIGYIFAAILAFLAFIVSLAAMIVDFILFTILRNEVNNHVNEATAHFGAMIWLVLAATILLFLASFFVIFGCCTHRKEDRYTRKDRDLAAEYRQREYRETGYVGQQATSQTYVPSEPATIVAEPIGYVQTKRTWWPAGSNNNTVRE